MSDDIEFSETEVYKKRVFFTKLIVYHVVGQKYLDYSDGVRIARTFPERYKIVVYQNPCTINEHLFEISYTGSFRRAKMWGEHKRKALWTMCSRSLTVRGLIAYCLSSMFSNKGYYKKY